uniref:Alkylated DNA repair protein alkB homolog 4 n=1 Tax=Caligus clemensi TaxID=344056 RepID=C1C0S6_CALCM|nr:Alkylated DNA repair protein alkB homolog 4 [Caligus clemensi]
MNTNRPCGCKSFRTCYKCEASISPDSNPYASLTRSLRSSQSGVFCVECESIYPGWELAATCSDHPPPILQSFSGIQIIPNFINHQEQEDLLKGLDSLPWDLSVSGRRKQNFGPRAKFNKRKAKNGPFSGFPACTEFVQKRFEEVDSLEGYQTVEQCSIEYQKNTGAWIEPHVDDCWIWGERIVQLHVLSSSVLTLTKCRKAHKYNLKDVSLYPKVLSTDGQRVLYNPFKSVSSSSPSEPFEISEEVADGRTPLDVIRIPLPEQSLLVMSGGPRYQWEHSVLREDIHDERRVIIAYREFTPPFLPGGDKFGDVGRAVIENARSFW